MQLVCQRSEQTRLGGQPPPKANALLLRRAPQLANTRQRLRRGSKQATVDGALAVLEPLSLEFDLGALGPEAAIRLART